MSNLKLRGLLSVREGAIFGEQLWLSRSVLFRLNASIEAQKRAAPPQ